MFFKKTIDTNHLIEEFMLWRNKLYQNQLGFIKKRKNKKHLFTQIRVNDEDKINSLYDIIKKFGYSINKSNSKNLSTSLNNLLNDVKGKPEGNMIETLTIRSMKKLFIQLKILDIMV